MVTSKSITVCLGLIVQLIACENTNLDKGTLTEKIEMKEQNDLAKVVQLVLEHPDLQQYFHVDTLPERKPLIILKNAFFSQPPSLVMFGAPVAFRTVQELQEDNKPYIEFVNLKLDQGRANVEFHYPPEGVLGNALLQKEQETWTIETFSISEE